MTYNARNDYIKRLLHHDEGEYKDGGNPRLPFGLCEKFGIKLPDDATPEVAWAALDEYGLSKEDVIASVEKYGDTSHIGKDDEKEGPTGTEEEMKYFNDNFSKIYSIAEKFADSGDFTTASLHYGVAADYMESALQDNETALIIKEQNPELYDAMQKQCEKSKNLGEQIKRISNILDDCSGIFPYDTLQLDDAALSDLLDKIDNDPYMFDHLDFMNDVENDIIKYKDAMTNFATALETVFNNQKLSLQEKRKKFNEIDKKLRSVYSKVKNGTYDFKGSTPLYKSLMQNFLCQVANSDGAEYMARSAIGARKFTYKDAAEGKYNSVQHSEEASIKDAWRKFGEQCFTQERKDNAVWCKDSHESRIKFTKTVGVKEDEMSQEQRIALDYYTDINGEHLNVFLNGYCDRYSPSDFDGIGNIDFTQNYGHDMSIGEHVDAITEMINSKMLTEDTWVQRGVGPGSIKMMFGLDTYSEEALEEAVNSGKPIHQYSFCSCGAAKNTGFTGKPIILNIYCPKGTAAAYVAPVCRFNENEMLLQRDTTFRPTKFTKGKDGKIYIDLEVIEQDPIDYSRTNSYRNS